MEERAYGESFDNTRELVKFLNDNKIPKESIVNILESRGQLLLLYYR